MQKKSSFRHFVSDKYFVPGGTLLFPAANWRGAIQIGTLLYQTEGILPRYGGDELEFISVWDNIEPVLVQVGNLTTYTTQNNIRLLLN